MTDDADLQQARCLLDALESHMDRLTEQIETAERQRPSGATVGRMERELRRELSEVHRHVTGIVERFPTVRITR